MKLLFILSVLNRLLFYECSYGRERLYPNEFSLSEVTFLESPFKYARDLDIKTTRNGKYLIAAKRFSHKMLLYPMSKGIDNLDDKHASAQMPKVIGFEGIGALSHDQTFGNAGRVRLEKNKDAINNRH